MGWLAGLTLEDEVRQDLSLLLGPNYIYKFMTLLLKDNYLIPSNDAKNLLETK